VNTVGVLARPDLTQAAAVLRELAAWLRARGAAVAVERRTAALADGAGLEGCLVLEGPQVAERADALVVLGGDGTLLAAAQLLGGRSVPVLGVNFGSLGFLTEITLAELYPALEGVLTGAYRHEERRMLRAAVTRSVGAAAEGDALNDVVVNKAAVVSRIIELEVRVDGVFVSLFRADGLILCSPTGSTAYNLAAGGPILHPALPALVLTPICPHMLTNRPLVVADDSHVAVRLHTPDVEVHVTLDGQRAVPLAGGDEVTVTRSPRTLRLVKAPSRDYFEILRTKLKWGESRSPRG
jgi:NAD+ kinase